MSEITDAGVRDVDFDEMQREYLITTAQWQNAHHAIVTISEELKAIERANLLGDVCCPEEELRLHNEMTVALLRAVDARNRIGDLRGRLADAR